MQELGNTLKAVMSNAVSPREPQPGSTTNAGQTSLLAIRQQPLTENQLTAIASQTLRQPFSITCEERKIYGQKKFTDDFGTGYVEDVIDTENITDCVVDINKNASVAVIQSSLMLSPQTAYLKHLTRLAIHKKFGSNDQDRAILLTDYVKALSEYPEFVVYQACKHYWENDKRPFVPFIAEIKEACEIFTNALKNHLKRMNEPVRAVIEKHKVEQKPEETWTPPTEEEKAKISNIVEQCIKNLSSFDQAAE